MRPESGTVEEGEKNDGLAVAGGAEGPRGEERAVSVTVSVEQLQRGPESSGEAAAPVSEFVEAANHAALCVLEEHVNKRRRGRGF